MSTIETEEHPPEPPDEVESDRRIRALSFGGGAFDTVMQLGVAHALLVADRRPPDYVVGISAGAINAAALAEILQTGQILEPDERLAACVRRLRGFIDGYVEIPREIIASTFPDTFEVNAQRALKPLELPVHFQGERNSRRDANRSKAGLIQLINHLLRIRLDISAATGIVRRALAISQAGELKRPKSPGVTRLWNYAGLWVATGLHAWSISQIVFTLLIAATRGRRHWVQHKTAGEIILEMRSLKEVANGLRYAAAFLAFLLLWALPLLILFGPLPRLVKDPIDRHSQLINSAGSGILRGAETAWHGLAGVGLRSIRGVPAFLVDTVVTVVNGAALLVSMALSSALAFVVAHRAALLVAIGFWLAALLLEVFLDFRSRYVLAAYVLLLAAGAVQRAEVIPALPLITGALLGLGVCAAVVRRESFATRLLEYYEVGDGILSSHILRDELVKRFNPEYYGKHVVSEMNETALRRGNEVSPDGGAHKRTLDEYRQQQPAIRVAPVAADLRDGKLKTIPTSTPIVDALLQATAITPLFPAQPDCAAEKTPVVGAPFRRQKKSKPATWYIDGLNVSNEPIQPLLDELRDEYDGLKKKAELSGEEKERLAYLDRAMTVDIYPVSDVPVDQLALKSEGSYSTLVDVGLRALELKSFRDATMERRLTRLYTRVLPGDHAFCEGPDRYYVHAGIFPVELEHPARINRRLTRGASIDDFRTILHESVADGCRAALEAMIPRAIAAVSDLPSWMNRNLNDPAIRRHPEIDLRLQASIRAARETEEGMTITLPRRLDNGFDEDVPVALPRSAFEELIGIIAPRCGDVVLRAKGQVLPGADLSAGPGISEICRQCRLFRPDEASASSKHAEPGNREGRIAFNDRSRLHARYERLNWPEWPHVKQERVPRLTATPAIRPPGKEDLAFPLSWPARDAATRPTISFLFGGGVFRGVFHIGVMNALSLADLKPDVVAGSSVGSIVAAMIASVFVERSPQVRVRRIREIAATFLAIDRFVLTDRLADFIRRLTLRAAESRFSPRDLDLLLRRYDVDFPARFNQRARKVIAGIERLFYVSPFELRTIVEAARLQNTSKLIDELCRDVQELLERGGVGEEILGSEPLSLLIARHVEDALSNARVSKRVVPSADRKARFDSFLRGTRPIYFIATATNLVRGALDILNAPLPDFRDVSLRNGLLASSAFPAIFRPRDSWEVFLSARRENEKYIDGGVIDNLPLDAVARVLDQAARTEGGRARINARPDVPHLLFTASLEITRDALPRGADTIDEICRNLFSLSKLAKTFKLNRKIDSYRAVQERLTGLYTKYEAEIGWKPLKLTVVAVKPRWLCGTFGFHPMLGFRRQKQAKSIAHGCASTLVHLAQVVAAHPEYQTAWQMKPLSFDTASVRYDSAEPPAVRELTPNHAGKDEKLGHCWFRVNQPCPFSAAYRTNELRVDKRYSPRELDELNRVYLLCGDRKTHEAAR